MTNGDCRSAKGMLQTYSRYAPLRRLGEVKQMADRIITMRSDLYNLLQELGSKKEWGHIKSQIGMVSRCSAIDYPPAAGKLT